MYYDLLVRIKNAQNAKKESLLAPFSKFDMAVAKVLEDNGYIKAAAKKEIGKKSFIEIKTAQKDGRPAIRNFRLISKPSRRIYSGYKEIRLVRQGDGASVLSTPAGIMSGKSARRSKVGGEYLFEIW